MESIRILGTNYWYPPTTTYTLSAPEQNNASRVTGVGAIPCYYTYGTTPHGEVSEWPSSGIKVSSSSKEGSSNVVFIQLSKERVVSSAYESRDYTIRSNTVIPSALLLKGETLQTYFTKPLNYEASLSGLVKRGIIEVYALVIPSYMYQYLASTKNFKVAYKVIKPDQLPSKIACLVNGNYYAVDSEAEPDHICCITDYSYAQDVGVDFTKITESDCILYDNKLYLTSLKIGNKAVFKSAMLQGKVSPPKLLTAIVNTNTDIHTYHSRTHTSLYDSSLQIDFKSGYLNLQAKLGQDLHINTKAESLYITREQAELLTTPMQGYYGTNTLPITLVPTAYKSEFLKEHIVSDKETGKYAYFSDSYSGVVNTVQKPDQANEFIAYLWDSLIDNELPLPARLVSLSNKLATKYTKEDVDTYVRLNKGTVLPKASLSFTDILHAIGFKGRGFFLADSNVNLNDIKALLTTQKCPFTSRQYLVLDRDGIINEILTNLNKYATASNVEFLGTMLSSTNLTKIYQDILLISAI